VFIAPSGHGTNYTKDPVSVDLCYEGTIDGETCLLQNGSFTSVSLLARGLNYADGDLCLVSDDEQYNNKSEPWKASFTVFSNGSIRDLRLDFQGVGYNEDPLFVDVCHKVRINCQHTDPAFNREEMILSVFNAGLIFTARTFNYHSGHCVQVRLYSFLVCVWNCDSNLN
jgi:hypothetical protein